MLIPRKIHYVWLGGRPLPARFEAYIAGWVRENPDFEIVRWDESNLDWTCEYTRAAHNAKAWAKLSDLMRLRAVFEHGGIYLDTDVQLVRSLDKLLNNHCFFGYQSVREEDEPICNAVFGAAAGHHFIQRLLNEFPLHLRDNFNSTGTGPEIVSSVLSMRGLPRQTDKYIQIDDVTIYPREYFYPYHWTENFSRACITPQTHAIHHWDMSWHEEKSWFRRMAKYQLKQHPSAYRGAKRLYRILGLKY